MENKINHVYAYNEHFLLRMPALSVEKYHTFASCKHYKELKQLKFLDIKQGSLLPRNTLIKNALMLSSLELFNALKSPSKAGNKELISKLELYLIRMSTRPTPYGLFAGVTVGKYSNTTSLKANYREIRFFARPDMGWILPYIQNIELDDRNLSHIKIYTNRYLIKFGNRLFLAEDRTQFSTDINDTKTNHVSVKNTKAVAEILELCNDGYDYSEIIKKLVKKYKVSKEKVKKVISQLLENKFLVSDFWPDTLTQNPLEKLASHIDSKNAIGSDLLLVNSILNKMNVSQSINIEQEYIPVSNIINRLNGKNYNTPLQLDSYYLTDIEACITNEVGQKVAEAAEILMLLSKFPNGKSDIEEYKNKFIEKYEYWREVPITELINEDIGLGIPYNRNSKDKHKIMQQISDSKSNILNTFILGTITNNKHTLELNDEQMNLILNESKEYKFIPSLDIFFQIFYDPKTVVAGNKYKIIISQLIGGTPAGAGMNRFSHLLNDKAKYVYEEVKTANIDSDPDIINSDVNYVPKSSRAMNVSIRHPIYEYFLSFWSKKSIANLKPIYVDDLVVGIKNNNFYVRWKEKNRLVKFHDTCMMNPELLPNIARLLIDLSNDGTAVLMPLSVAYLENSPFLPRIEYNNIILKLAQCNFDRYAIDKIIKDSTEEEFCISIKRILNKFEMGRYIYLTEKDNRLLLDTESKLHMSQLYTTFKNAKKNIIIQESLFENQLTFEINNEHYITEYVTSVYLNKTHFNNKILPIVPNNFDSTEFRREIGSEWLFIKFYTLTDLETDVINQIAEFTKSNKKNFRKSFFIRYGDPDSHIRLRFNGNPKKLLKLLPKLIEFGGNLIKSNMCTKFVFDTYDRELGRYGGINGTNIAENIFSIDSSSAMNALKSISQTDENTKLLTTALSADLMFKNLGINLNERNLMYREFSKGLKQQNTNFASIAKSLAESISNISEYKEKSMVFDENFSIYKRLGRYGTKLKKLECDKKLSSSLGDIYSAYLHMHCNRFLGTDANSEATVRILLKRASEIALYKKN